MKRLLLTWGPIAFLVSFCMTAFAQVTEPGSVDQAVGMLPGIIAAFQTAKPLLGCALIVLILVFVIKQYILPKLNVSTSILPWVSVVLGILSAIAVGVSGGASPAQAAMAMLSGPAASSFWDMILKYFAPKPAA